MIAHDLQTDATRIDESLRNYCRRRESRRERRSGGFRFEAGRERQANAEVRSRKRAVHDLDRASMRLHEFVDDRQPDASPFKCPAVGARPE